MVMGNGSRLDADSIDASVEILRRELDTGVVQVRFKHTQDDEFGPRNGLPREARVTVMPGIHQKAGYFDIQWWENGDYKYHYKEEDLEFRFGREAANAEIDQPVCHFHPPEDTNEHRQSCISDGHPPERVTLAVLTSWWAAVKKHDESVLNTQKGLP